MKISAEVPHTSIYFSVKVSRSGNIRRYSDNTPSLAALYKCLRIQFVVYNWFIQCFSFLLTNFGSRGVLRISSDKDGLNLLETKLPLIMNDQITAPLHCD